MSLLYSSGGGDDGWRPDTAQSHLVDERAPVPERSLATTAGRSLPSRAMNRMIDHLVDRKAVLTKMFVEYDTDNSGTIDADELNAALTALGLRLSAEEIDGIMRRLDSDGGGDIDLQEFIDHFKKARAERFDGHIPEIKQAKMELLRKLRTHAPLQIDGGAGLYKMLVQIEQLQALEHLTAEQVAELRAQIIEMVKSGMTVGPTQAQALQASIRRHAMPTFNQTQKYSSGRWDENRPKPWKIGSHEIKGPKMEMARSRKRLSTAEWERRSTEVKLGELDAGQHRSEPKRPWDTRQAKHTFATDSGQTAITMAQPRARNAEWAPNGLLEEETKAKRSEGGAGSSAAPESAQNTSTDASSSKAKRKSKSKQHTRGSRGTPNWVSQSGGFGTYGGALLGQSKSMSELDPMPAPMDGTGRPPLGYAPAEPAADPWSSARFSQGGGMADANDGGEAQGANTNGGDDEPGLLGGLAMDSERGGNLHLLTDTRGFESSRGYSTIIDGGEKPAPVPTLLQMAPPPPGGNNLDQHGGGGGRDSLYPSEIRGTMQSSYRGKFAEGGERGPLNEFAHVSQVSGNGLDQAPPQTPSKLEVEKFLRYGLRPDNWKQATQSASREAGLRWSTGGGTHPAYGGGAHGLVAGTVWLE